MKEKSEFQFELGNKNKWSDSRFAWYYAVIILLAVVAFAVILKVMGIYESMAWRGVHIFFIFGGLIILLQDYKYHKHIQLDYTQAAILCTRAGIYFALLFLPLLAMIIGGYPTEQDIINKEELFTSNYPVEEIVFVNWIETIATVAIASFVVPLSRGFGKDVS